MEVSAPQNTGYPRSIQATAIWDRGLNKPGVSNRRSLSRSAARPLLASAFALRVYRMRPPTPLERWGLGAVCSRPTTRSDRHWNQPHRSCGHSPALRPPADKPMRSPVGPAGSATIFLKTNGLGGICFGIGSYLFSRTSIWTTALQ